MKRSGDNDRIRPNNAHSERYALLPTTGMTRDRLDELRRVREGLKICLRFILYVQATSGGVSATDVHIDVHDVSNTGNAQKQVISAA